MDRIVLMVIIGLLFGTTLYQAREIGELGGNLSVMDATLKHQAKVERIKQAHQLERDQIKSANNTLIQGLKNDLIEMASDFEEKGLADPIALGDRESDWLNNFVRRNSRDSEQGPHISPPDSSETIKTED